MEYAAEPPFLEHLVLASTVARSGRTSEFYRAARLGRYVRLAEGVFLPTSVWSSLHSDQRFLARVHAVAQTSRRALVFSHFAAAALWRMPIVGPWPAMVEVTVGTGAVGATRRAYRARKYPLPNDPDAIDRLSVTSLSRTLVDVGRVGRLSVAVSMMDRALAPKPPQARGLDGVRIASASLAAEYASMTSARGRARCATAIELADGASGSVGESVSRCGMFLLGLPAPVLQHPFRDSRGLVGIVDFWWPQFDLIGEFDGFGKYLREELHPGQTVADVVMAEKRREDRLRALGPRVTRWGWRTAQSLQSLERHLREAGLR